MIFNTVFTINGGNKMNQNNITFNNNEKNGDCGFGV
jgi:hypothetical protein